ncbi:MAG: aminotransferase class I/II-fold pyridoxal phosphate-dependent enzyme [Lentimicrobium sp.]|jgi:aspartate/methionine/tyrosine aminotransferase|nr:aminotransferase class I/II-fold pyridoxal phosphate-dependent enzyme [Lentimicrobium sp.]MDD2528878.1 aminotransferase class I/II-fold pyridoxal phosphate-dependent enzyme [Lentimicrobiaceae bacterium]MDD4598515.1 aminotransferase class I/II-fold pyridoxal phosphate-dependent enzyme [Lentimicrobiaceae bacterium]MDY0026114.1 aminotransferase class I/II-fold pyridoxal phosphate-dependent enzyme [Lentimicrobium sp.]
MKINDFKLERYFAQHEFTAKYLFSSSDCDGFEMKYVLEQASDNEMGLWEKQTLGYTESEGHPLLRKAIMQYYNSGNLTNVVVASPGELNFITMNVLLQAGDHVVVVSPCYQSLSEVVKSLNCEISYWQPDPGSWEFDPAELETLIRSNTRLIILNFPHNPTGAYLKRQQLDEIICIAEKHNAWIFSDEMYRKLMISEMPELPPISDIYVKGISLWGTSKTFGLAGLRIGWLVAQDKAFLNKVVAFKDYLSICSSAPSEILAMIALNHPEKFIQPNLKKIKANIEVFSAFTLHHNELFTFIPPKAGSVAFVKMNIHEPALDFCNRLVEETGIMTVPGEMFHYPGKFLRVGFGRRNFPEVLEKLETYLDQTTRI